MAFKKQQAAEENGSTQGELIPMVADYLPATFKGMLEDAVSPENLVPDDSFTRFSKSKLAEYDIVFLVTGMLAKRGAQNIYYICTLRTQHDIEGSIVVGDDGREGQRRALFYALQNNEKPIGPFVLRSFPTSYGKDGYKFRRLDQKALQYYLANPGTPTPAAYIDDSSEEDESFWNTGTTQE